MSSLSIFEEERQGKKVVFTNGCFDLIHIGHVHYLEEAKRLGDILFVGLNSDKSVHRLKGKGRPINDELSRKGVLGALRMVDFVEIFEEDTPLKLILKVRPNILVKGGDWKEEDIVGSKELKSWGGEVRSLSFIEGHSSTKLMAKIKTQL